MTAYGYIEQYKADFPQANVNFEVYDIETHKPITDVDKWQKVEVVSAEWKNWNRYKTPETRRLYCKLA